MILSSITSSTKIISFQLLFCEFNHLAKARTSFPNPPAQYIANIIPVVSNQKILTL